MARIVDGPVYKRVKCNACGSTIEYLPEEVKRLSGREQYNGPDNKEWVDCPREKCPGEGVISSW